MFRAVSKYLRNSFARIDKKILLYSMIITFMSLVTIFSARENFGTSKFVMQIAMVLGLVFVVLPLGALLAEATYGMACTLVALLLLMILMIEVAVACLFHFLTLGKLEQKLNLS